MKAETWTVTICCESEAHPKKRVKIHTERLMRFVEPLTPWVLQSPATILVDDTPTVHEPTFDELDGLLDAGRARTHHEYRCPKCGESKRIPGEQVVTEMKDAAARGVSRVLLSVFD